MIRFRFFPGALRTRMALAFTALLVCATVVALLHSATRLAQSQLGSQRELAHSLIGLLEPAVQQLALRPGLTAGVEILVAHLKEALTLPVARILICLHSRNVCPG